MLQPEDKIRCRGDAAGSGVCAFDQIPPGCGRCYCRICPQSACISNNSAPNKVKCDKGTAVAIGKNTTEDQVSV